MPNFKLKTMYKFKLRVALLSLLLISHVTFAQLSVSPKRVIFENRERSQELLLINTGETTKKYRIHFKQLKMTQDGDYETIEGNGSEDDFFASKAVRFSPRQVTLKPGMTQTIRLLVRKPKGFKDGEYRSHLTFSEIPDDGDQFGVERPQQPQGFAFQMRPLLGMSIPIILRQGKLSQGVEIKNTSLSKDAVSLELHRQGQASVYGQINAVFQPESGLPPIEVGEIKGVSVLTPLDWRKVTIPLTEEVNALGAGELKITYSNLEENSAKKLPILSEHSLKL